MGKNVKDMKFLVITEAEHIPHHGGSDYSRIVLSDDESELMRTYIDAVNNVTEYLMNSHDFDPDAQASEDDVEDDDEDEEYEDEEYEDEFTGWREFLGRDSVSLEDIKNLNEEVLDVSLYCECYAEGYDILKTALDFWKGACYTTPTLDDYEDFDDEDDGIEQIKRLLMNPDDYEALSELIDIIENSVHGW